MPGQAGRRLRTNPTDETPVPDNSAAGIVLAVHTAERLRRESLAPRVIDNFTDANPASSTPASRDASHAVPTRLSVPCQCHDIKTN
jgi:hypothetical protein